MVSRILRNGSSAYVGWRLDELATPRACGWEPEAYATAYPSRMVEFVRWLVNPGDERITYDLRFVVEPGERYSSGRVDAVLLCRMDQGSSPLPSRHLDVVSSKLEADFGDEYAFSQLAAEQIARLLRPFPVVGSAVVRRRTAWETLDTIRPAERSVVQRDVGFGADPLLADSSQEGPSRVLHTFEFAPAFGPVAPLTGLLLRLDSPTTVSIRLQPTRLRDPEAAFLEEQIAICERFAQFMPDPARSPSSLEPTLAEQARWYRSVFESQLDGLRDDAAVLMVSIASAERVPSIVVDTLGTWITGPAGGTDHNVDPMRHLSGGYELVAASPRDIEALETLAVSLPSDTPSEAGRLPYLFDSVAAAAAMRWPPLEDHDVPGFEVRDWRSLVPPPTFPEDGTSVGVTVGPDQRPVALPEEDRLLHTYVIGRTGSGKTTLLERMILDDIAAGGGVCVIDPHGDLFNGLLGKIPKSRVDDVVVLDPNDVDHPVGLNPLEFGTPEERDRMIGEVQAALVRFVTDEYGAASGLQMVGPVFMDLVDVGLRLITSRREEPGTLPQLYGIFAVEKLWRRWDPVSDDDPLLGRRIRDFQRVNMLGSSDGSISLGGYVRSKFSEFVNTVALRNIIGQARSSFDIGEVLDTRKIMLVNLGVGEESRNPLSPRQARLLGMLLVAQIYSAAKSRPADRRRPFHLYIDEFQNVATATFADMLSEVRKFGVGLVLANQYLTQIEDDRIRHALFGNVGTTVVFPVGHTDARQLEAEMVPLDSLDLVNLPVWHAYVRSPHRSGHPFVVSTNAATNRFSASRAAAIRRVSRRRYGRPRRDVEREIAESLQEPVEKGARGKAERNMDVLDEWLSERWDQRDQDRLRGRGVSRATINILDEHGLLEVVDLDTMSDDELLAVPGIGPKRLRDLRTALADDG